jgi:hypothetical protein
MAVAGVLRLNLPYGMVGTVNGVINMFKVFG